MRFNAGLNGDRSCASSGGKRLTIRLADVKGTAPRGMLIIKFFRRRPLRTHSSTDAIKEMVPALRFAFANASYSRAREARRLQRRATGPFFPCTRRKKIIRVRFSRGRTAREGRGGEGGGRATFASSPTPSSFYRPLPRGERASSASRCARTRRTAFIARAPMFPHSGILFLKEEYTRAARARARLVGAVAKMRFAPCQILSRGNTDTGVAILWSARDSTRHITT